MKYLFIFFILISLAYATDQSIHLYPEKLSKGLALKGWPPSSVVKDSPSESGKDVVRLAAPGHWSLETLTLTGKVEGDWAEVEYTKDKHKANDCDEKPPVALRKRGWIKAMGKDKKFLLWSWSYEGLC